jgi:exodeoxyribonuclease VII large subunit
MALDSTTSSPIPIGDFVQFVKQTIVQDPQFQLQTLKGEISQWKEHNNNIYFALRDEKGQMNCVIWNTSIPIDPSIKEGSEVIVIANLDLWPKQGRIQLVVKKIMPVLSIGELELAKRELLAQLRQEGALDRPKKPLPILPKHVMIITGKNSAALADMKRLAMLRYPNLRISVVEVLVQGQQAAQEIARALAVSRAWADKQGAEKLGIVPVDVVIVGRGGGSVEDLWAFNLEQVARAILASPIPVVSAVGHESDILVSDLVADVRASTPSHAVELVVPDRLNLEQWLDELEMRSSLAMSRYLERNRTQLNFLFKRLASAPKAGVVAMHRQLDGLKSRLAASVKSSTNQFKQQLIQMQSTLNAAHPQRTLERGYAMIESEGAVVQSIHDIEEGQTILLRLADGKAHSTIQEKKIGEENE